LTDICNKAIIKDPAKHLSADCNTIFSIPYTGKHTNFKAATVFFTGKHVWSVLESLIIALLQFYCWISHWKNDENQSIFDEGMTKTSRVIFGPLCIWSSHRCSFLCGRGVGDYAVGVAVWW